MKLYEKYLNEGKNLEPFVMTYPEVDTKKDGMKILKSIKSYIDKNFEVRTSRIHTEDRMYFVVYYDKMEKTPILKRKKTEIYNIIFSWEKYKAKTYKGKELDGPVWSATMEVSQYDNWYITNYKDIDRGFQKVGIEKK